MKLRTFLAAWVLLALQGERVPASSLTESPPWTPLDLGSAVLADGGTVSFLSPNNSRLLAHQGSEVRLQCQIDKPPNSAMVTNNNIINNNNNSIIVFRSPGPGGPEDLTLEREICNYFQWETTLTSATTDLSSAIRKLTM